MDIKDFHFAPNGYVHAGSIVTLADTIAGYGCLRNLPDKGISFTTIELKTNFLVSIKSGAVMAEANLHHGLATDYTSRIGFYGLIPVIYKHVSIKNSAIMIKKNLSPHSMNFTEN